MSSNATDESRKPQNLPKILDGKFYNNIQPHPKTPGGIQATCTSCFGIISGTTKSTGNFLSHIKRRHKDILASCQLYCSAKSLSCFNQADIKFPPGVPFPVAMASNPVPFVVSFPNSTKESKQQGVVTSPPARNIITSTVMTSYVRGDLTPTTATSGNNVIHPTNGVFKQSPSSHI